MATNLRVPMRVRVDDGIRESCQGEGPQAAVIFKVPFPVRYLLTQDLLGKVTGTPATGITRERPFAYPPDPSLYCLEIADIRNYGSPRRDIFGFLSYQWSDITAIFRRPPYDFGGAFPWTTISVSGSAEIISMPRGFMVFEDDGVVTETLPGMRIFQQTINIKRHRMPFIPAAAIQPLLGTLNAADYEILGTVYPAGTLLFADFASDWQIDSAGSMMYEIDYRLLYRSVEWNKAMHPTPGKGWRYLNQQKLGTVDKRPYAYADYTAIP